MNVRCLVFCYSNTSFLYSNSQNCNRSWQDKISLFRCKDYSTSGKSK